MSPTLSEILCNADAQKKGNPKKCSHTAERGTRTARCNPLHCEKRCAEA